jgi:hypothetical protein
MKKKKFQKNSQCSAMNPVRLGVLSACLVAVGLLLGYCWASPARFPIRHESQSPVQIGSALLQAVYCDLLHLSAWIPLPICPTDDGGGGGRPLSGARRTLDRLILGFGLLLMLGTGLACFTLSSLLLVAAADGRPSAARQWWAGLAGLLCPMLVLFGIAEISNSLRWNQIYSSDPQLQAAVQEFYHRIQRTMGSFS